MQKAVFRYLILHYEISFFLDFLILLSTAVSNSTLLYTTVQKSINLGKVVGVPHFAIYTRPKKKKKSTGMPHLRKPKCASWYDEKKYTKKIIHNSKNA
jgi:hypothetical protein